MNPHHEAGPDGSSVAAPGVRATSSSPPAAQRRDAIIFLPGLNTLEHRSQAHVMEVLCNEFDRAAATETARFAVRPNSAQSGDNVEVVRTIWRIDGDDRSPVADVYWLDYETIQQVDATPTNPLARVLTLALTALAGVLIWVAAWFRRNRGAKPGAQMLQLLICLVILLVLGAYLVAAVIALVQLIMTAYANATGAAARTITWPQGFVIVGAVLGTLLPGVREQWSKAAEQYLRMMRYLWVAGPRNSLRGEVLTLLEHASERLDEVGRIHIVGFSFGSLVAIDTVFPASRAPTARMARVKSLATIGCPFDLVRMLQPRYFEDRFAAADADRPWINIYDPIDVLGSNFRNDSEQGPATEGVVTTSPVDTKRPTANTPWNPGQRLTLVSGLMLASLRVHAQYWGSNPRAETALGPLVTELFSGTPALR
jgi:hypothetical protein